MPISTLTAYRSSHIGKTIFFSKDQMYVGLLSLSKMSFENHALSFVLRWLLAPPWSRFNCFSYMPKCATSYLSINLGCPMVFLPAAKPSRSRRGESPPYDKSRIEYFLDMALPSSLVISNWTHGVVQGHQGVQQVKFSVVEGIRGPKITPQV